MTKTNENCRNFANRFIGRFRGPTSPLLIGALITLSAGACTEEETTETGGIEVVTKPVTAEPPIGHMEPDSRMPVDNAQSKREVPSAARIGRDETTRRKAAILVTQIKNGEFPYAERTKLENADAFLHLAETSTTPHFVMAALGGLAAVFSPHNVPGKRRVFPGYHRVVLKHLASDSPPVALAAFAPARQSVTTVPPDVAVVNKLVEIATTHKHPAAKLRAIQALRNHKGVGEPVQRAILATLDSKEKFLVVGTLDSMELVGYEFVDGAALEKKLLALLDNPAEEIRGAAARILARPSSLPRATKTRRAEALLPLLADKSAHVRSSVLDSLGRLRHFPSINRLMAQTGNLEPDKIVLPFADFDGATAKLYLRVSAVGVVGSSAMFGLKLMTLRTPINLNYKPMASLKEMPRAANEVRAWHSANRKAIKKLMASKI